MRRYLPIAFLLLCIFATPLAEARTLWGNIGFIGGGVLAIAAGVGLAAISTAAIIHGLAAAPLLAGALILTGVVSLGIGAYDQYRNTVSPQPVESGTAWENIIDYDTDAAMRDFERRQRESMDALQGKSTPTWRKKLKSLIVKDAEAAELPPPGDLEPLPSIEDFISNTPNPKDDTPERQARREERRQALKERRQARKVSANANGEPAEDETQFDFDLNDDSYDWCDCDEPTGLFETENMVSFGCTKCMRTNREYARKAVELEKRLKTRGQSGQWHGTNAKAAARRATQQ